MPEPTPLGLGRYESLLLLSLVPNSLAELSGSQMRGKGGQRLTPIRGCRMAFLPQMDLLRTTTAWILCRGKWKGAVPSEEDTDVGYEDKRHVGKEGGRRMEKKKQQQLQVMGWCCRGTATAGNRGGKERFLQCFCQRLLHHHHTCSYDGFA